MTRMHSLVEPITGISVEQIRGMSPKPISRAAVAGKTDEMSPVAVKKTEMMSPWVTSFLLIMASRSSCTLGNMDSAESSITVVAPRIALTRS